MLHTVSELLECSVFGSDGVVGRVVDAYFDTRSWRICCLLLEFPAANGNKAVVLSADAVVAIDKTKSRVHIADVPSRKSGSAQLRGLRSTRRVLGGAVTGWTGALGHTEDAIFETDSWVLQFLMIDMSSWRPGGVAFIQPSLVEKESWRQRSLRIAVAHVELMRLCEEDDSAWIGDGPQSRRAPRDLN